MRKWNNIEWEMVLWGHPNCRAWKIVGPFFPWSGVGEDGTLVVLILAMLQRRARMEALSPGML